MIENIFFFLQLSVICRLQERRGRGVKCGKCCKGHDSESDVQTRAEPQAVNGLMTAGEEGGSLSKRLVYSCLIHVIVSLHHSCYI